MLFWFVIAMAQELPDAEPDTEVDTDAEVDTDTEVDHDADTELWSDIDATIVIAPRTWRVVKRGERTADEGTVTGVYELTRRDIEATPGSLEDITRAVHALPGVVADGDLLAGFNVRGGEQADVVYLLDRVPLENPFHLAGFNSLFNPDMIDGVTLYAGGAPADVPSATSAVMAVTSWDGLPRREGGGYDGSVDLSASSARVQLIGPLDDDETFTMALAARRTYLEGYLQILKWANIIDRAVAAPEYGELSARFGWRPSDRHRVLFTSLLSGDSFALRDSADESTITVNGDFVLRNSLLLFSLDHRYDSDAFVWQTTAAYTGDRGRQQRSIGGNAERLDRFRRAFARTDLTFGQGEPHTVKMGADASQLWLDTTGDIEDDRAIPTYTTAGIADFGLPFTGLTTDRTWMEANAYLQYEYTGPVRVRLGGRGTYAGLSDDWLFSPRAGLSVPLPTGTIPKVTVGRYHRIERDPNRLSAGFGNPELRPERALHLIAGVDQAFPLPGADNGGLVRLEAYHIGLDRLVVNPDTVEAVEQGTTFESIGTGRNRGADLMVAARTRDWTAQVVYSLLFATRTNPLVRDLEQTVAPAQDQRHTLALMGDWQATLRWKFTAQYRFHTGRPVSLVEVASEDTVQLGCINCSRLGPTHNVDLRAEWRRTYPKKQLTFYVEVLNVGNIQSDFLPIYTVEDGELVTSTFRHLPMRPFLGLRWEF